VLGQVGTEPYGFHQNLRRLTNMNTHSILNKPMSDGEVVIGVFPKNATEDVRITLGKFEGFDVLAIRVWYTAEDGRPRPGNKGLTIRAALLPELLNLLERACDVAKDRGLLGKRARPPVEKVVLEAEEMPEDDEALE
jgi:Transcriptional Coactivator p15 (PC4)